MEVEALRRMGKRQKDNKKVAVAVTQQDSKMAKVIRESRWMSVTNMTQIMPKGRSTAIVKKFQRGSDNFHTGSGNTLGTAQITSPRKPFPRDKKIEIWENTLNHYCSDHSKCHHPAHQGCQ
jgi:hypothetical protein